MPLISVSWAVVLKDLVVLNRSSQVMIAEKYAMWQRDRATMEITKILGEGNFGSVMLAKMPDAIVPGVTSLVAVKAIKGKITYNILNYTISYILYGFTV